MKRSKILIVDDERTIRLTFRLALETAGYEVQEAATVDEAAMALQGEAYDLVVLDLRLGEDSGLDVLAQMREGNNLTPTLMITAYGSIRQAVRAMQLGAIDFLEKPIEPVALREVVASILDRHQVRPADPTTDNFEDHLREAKRLINLRRFEDAARTVAEALKLNQHSPEAYNLQGILYEIGGNYDTAKRFYGQAIRLDSRHEGAQQNMRRLYELFNFGRSDEPQHLGSKS